MKTFDFFNRTFREMKNKNMLMKSEDIDLKFTDLMNYINSNIVTYVNRVLSSGDFPLTGTIKPNDRSFLSSDRNGRVHWSNLSDSLKVNSIKLSDLSPLKERPLSILTTDNRKNITYSPIVNENSILAFTPEKSIHWKLIETNNIQEQSIIGDSVKDEEITLEHWDAKSVEIDYNQILTSHFNAKSITRKKLKRNKSISFKALGQIHDKFPERLLVKLSYIKDKTITPNLIRSYSIDHSFFNKTICVLSHHIAMNSVDDDYFHKDLIFNNATVNENFQLTSDKIKKNTLSPEDFSEPLKTEIMTLLNKQTNNE